MELKTKDLIALLNSDEKTILKWIKEKKLPAYKINHQYHFNKTEVKEWILENKIEVSSKILDMGDSHTPVDLCVLLQRGGIHFNIKGHTPIEVIKNAVPLIHLPPEVNTETVIYSLIEREEMMPTAIGKGIAIPHPRNPIIADIDNENVALCLLEKPIDYNALDNKPVFLIFIILSANAKRHLQILSHISFLCQNGEFSQYLHQAHTKEEIFAWIQDKEAQWQKHKAV